jgi:hypothetical protein
MQNDEILKKKPHKQIKEKKSDSQKKHLAKYTKV